MRIGVDSATTIAIFVGLGMCAFATIAIGIQMFLFGFDFAVAAFGPVLFAGVKLASLR